MTSDDCSKIVELYLRHLSQNFHVSKWSKGCIITTPFLKSDNDPMQMYIEKISDGSYYISDFGDTIADLEMIGLNIFSGKKHELLDKSLKRHGISLAGSSLELRADRTNLADAVHRFIQTMGDINHLENMIRSREIVDFNKVVHEFLLDQKIEHEYVERNYVPVVYQNQEIPVDFKVSVELKGALGVLMRTYHVEDKNQAMNQVKSKVTSFYFLKVLNAPYKGISIVDMESAIFTPTAYKHISASSDYVIDWKEREDLPKIIEESRMDLLR